MVEGGMKCVKFLIFGFNLLFVLVGIALIACGAYVKIQLKQYLTLLDGNFDSAAILLIVVGVFIFIIASFGCCGAFRENHHCVMIYAVLLGIIFILEIAGGIAGFVMKGKVDETVKTLMYESLNKNDKIWNDVQKEFSCCGVEQPSDWNTTVPTSCCLNHDQCDTNVTANIYQEGCYKKFAKWVQDKIVIVGGIGIGFAVIQIFGILFACCLARAIKKEYEVV